MLHVVKLIERRFPNSANRVITALLALSASGWPSELKLCCYGSLDNDRARLRGGLLHAR
jgi:hypothetical protein